MIDASTLQQWHTRLDVAQAGHYRQGEIYAVIDFLFGIPVVVLSSFVSTVLFIDPKESKVDSMARIAGAAVVGITSIQTFARPAEKAEQHRSKAAKYGSLKRKVEFFIAAQNTEVASEKEFLRDLETSWNSIAEDSPTTWHIVRKMVKGVFQADIHRQLSAGSVPPTDQQ